MCVLSSNQCGSYRTYVSDVNFRKTGRIVDNYYIDVTRIILS